MPSPPAHSSLLAIELWFHGDLLDFCKGLRQSPHRQRYPLQRRASIKDIIESLGIPHTEVGRIEQGGCDLDFSFIPTGGERLEIHPQTPDMPVTRPSTLRPSPLNRICFLADATVGKLARLLRLAGLDTTTAAAQQPISVVAATAVRDRRILLTRNRELLKRRLVTHGRLLRNQDPQQQFTEVSHLYHLPPLYRPFSRCAVCNAVLEEVDKEAVINRLEPLTRRYYDHFKQCPACNRIYWQGSHQQRLNHLFGWSSP